MSSQPVSPYVYQRKPIQSQAVLKTIDTPTPMKVVTFPGVENEYDACEEDIVDNRIRGKEEKEVRGNEEHRGNGGPFGAFSKIFNLEFDMEVIMLIGLAALLLGEQEKDIMMLLVLGFLILDF